MDFYEFMAEYGIIGFSISTALGISFNNVIKSTTNEIITPLLGMLFRVKDLKDYHINIGNQDIFVGKFLESLISYISIIGIIYFMARYVFHNMIQRIIKLKKEHDVKLLREQEKTSKTLNKLYELEKDNYVIL